MMNDIHEVIGERRLSIKKAYCEDNNFASDWYFKLVARSGQRAGDSQMMQETPTGWKHLRGTSTSSTKARKWS
jgi:hypothetical protein